MCESRSCGVCLVKYDDGERRPLLLPSCGHTFCRKCLVLIYKDAAKLCPTCRKDCGLTMLNDLPTNYESLPSTNYEALPRKVNAVTEKMMNGGWWCLDTPEMFSSATTLIKDGVRPGALTVNLDIVALDNPAMTTLLEVLVNKKYKPFIQLMHLKNFWTPTTDDAAAVKKFTQLGFIIKEFWGRIEEYGDLVFLQTAYTMGFGISSASDLSRLVAILSKPGNPATIHIAVDRSTEMPGEIGKFDHYRISFLHLCNMGDGDIPWMASIINKVNALNRRSFIGLCLPQSNFSSTGAATLARYLPGVVKNVSGYLVGAVNKVFLESSLITLKDQEKLITFFKSKEIDIIFNMNEFYKTGVKSDPMYTQDF